jgi:hypothetical protein
MALSDDIYRMGGRCDFCGGRIWFMRVLGDRASGVTLSGRRVSGQFYAAHGRCYKASQTTLEGPIPEHPALKPETAPRWTGDIPSFDAVMKQAQRMADELPMDRMGVAIADDVLTAVDRAVEQALLPTASEAAKLMVLVVSAVISWTAGRQFSVEAYRGSKTEELFDAFAGQLEVGYVKRTLARGEDGQLLRFDLSAYIKRSLNEASADAPADADVIPLVDEWAAAQLGEYSTAMQQPTAAFVAELRLKIRQQCYQSMVFNAGRLL